MIHCCDQWSTQTYICMQKCGKTIIWGNNIKILHQELNPNIFNTIRAKTNILIFPSLLGQVGCEKLWSAILQFCQYLSSPIFWAFLLTAWTNIKKLCVGHNCSAKCKTLIIGFCGLNQKIIPQISVSGYGLQEMWKQGDKFWESDPERQNEL